LITFEQVAKTYRSAFGRRVDAVVDVSFTIGDGEVVGIAGPNGAGKSTLIALMLGLVSPTSGRVRLSGSAPRDFAEQIGVGYLPELIPLNPLWPAEQALRRFAVLGGVPAADVQNRVNDVIERVGLAEHRRKRCKQLSKGNLQKVGLAQSLLRDERVYVFDEPTHGLDPVWSQQFREIIQQLRRPDRCMLVASHNLDELERICDRVVIIDRGRVQRIVDLHGAAPDTSRYRVRVAAGVAHLLGAFPGAAETAPGEILIPDVDLSALNLGLARAIGEGALLSSVQPDKSALEREFHDAVRPSGGAS
jgi:ABC-type multidrug transport system ATPase subunit